MNDKIISCQCNRDALIIDRVSISRIVAALILLFFIAFISGYFLGKKHAVEPFAYKIDQESFADQIYYSLSAHYDPKGGQDVSEINDESENSESIDHTTAHNDKAVPEPSTQTATSNNLSEQKPIGVLADPMIKVQTDKQYQAQLFGGSERDAKACAEKLTKRGYSVHVIRRISKTPKGKPMYWFQVVTDIFNDKEKLITLVNTIKAQERIKQAPIVEI